MSVCNVLESAFLIDAANLNRIHVSMEMVITLIRDDNYVFSFLLKYLNKHFGTMVSDNMYFVINVEPWSRVRLSFLPSYITQCSHFCAHNWETVKFERVIFILFTNFTEGTIFISYYRC